MSFASSTLGRSRTMQGKNKAVKLRRGKTYSSLRIKKAKRRKSNSISDQNTLWRMSNENLLDASRPPVDKADLRKSEIQERDTFLDLLCKVQDNRYDNQRYTLKAGSLTDHDESNPDDVFEDPLKPGGDDPDTIIVNGSIPNGKISGMNQLSPPSAKKSPKMRKARTMGDLPTVQFQESIDCPLAGSGSSAGDAELRRDSLSPPLMMAMGPGGIMTPSRKTMEAMKKLIAKEGPYPMLMAPPDGGYWIKNGEHESARDDNGIWRAPEIDTEHFTIEMDTVANVYRKYFKGQEHANYISRDSKVGPVLLSIKTEQDYQGMLYRAVLRTQKATAYKVMPKSQLPDHMEPEDFIKFISRISGEELSVEKVIRIANPKAEEWIQKFDEHTIDKCHKFGVIYQKKGQTCEEELFGNVTHPEALDEFLDVLGEKIQLKGFEGYRGGLDVTNNQTGESSVYTEYKDRKIMFHVSTLLPHDPGDTQHVQKKRHIGNDIVVIIFQDTNTPFSPNMIRSHFIHSYIVVQVEHANTDHTVYKVAVTAKESVPDFGPPLPDPAVFQKGSEFRDWLLTKALNAEFKCHMAPSFKKLATRTRGQLFLHLVGEIAQVIEDTDLSPSARSLAMSLQASGSGPDLRSVRNRRRRRTLAGIFNRGASVKDNHQQQQNSSLLSFPKRKSVSISPRNFRKSSLLVEGPTSPVRAMMLGSTPDLTMAQEDLSNGRVVHIDVPDSPDVDGMRSKRKRRFTFKKSDKDKKTKRTASVSGASATNVIKRSSLKRDNSDESSLSSALNWSVPYDLPGTVAADDFDEYYYDSSSSQLKAKWKSNPTILERNESSDSISLHDVDISVDIPMTSEVAIQVGDNESVARFPSPPTARRVNLRLHHHHSNKPIHLSPMLTRSLPSTPQKHRRQQYVNVPVSGEQEDSSPDQSMQRSRKIYPRKSSKSTITAQLVKIHDGDSPEEKERNINQVVHRVRSHDSVTSELDEKYGKLFESLQVLTDEVAHLKRENLALFKENTKFATQNERLKDRYSDMKQQLVDSQKTIIELQLKLKLYHPEFSRADTD